MTSAEFQAKATEIASGIANWCRAHQTAAWMIAAFVAGFILGKIL